MAVIVDATKEDDLRERRDVGHCRLIPGRWGEVASNRELLIPTWLLRRNGGRRRSAAASTCARRQQRHRRNEPRKFHVHASYAGGASTAGHSCQSYARRARPQGAEYLGREV